MGGGSIGIDFNLQSGSWEVRVARLFGGGGWMWWESLVCKFFCGLFVKTFRRGGLRGLASDGDGAF